MFAYCFNNPVNYSDPNGEFGILFAFVATAVIAGISNAVSTAINDGTVEDCVAAGLIGAVSATVGFGVAVITGFTPWGNIAARAISSTLCDLGTAFYTSKGSITQEDAGKTVVDVTMDALFSTITYGYTAPIVDLGVNALVNATIDGLVDIGESYLFGSNNMTSNDSTAQNIDCSTSSRYACKGLGRVKVYGN